MIHNFWKLPEFVRVGRTIFAWTIWISVILSPIIWFVSCSVEPQTLLLFERRTTEKSQIYTARPDGSQLTFLTEVPLSNWFWLSPTGSHLAFLSLNEQDNSYNLKILDTVSSKIIEDIPQVGQTWSEHIPWQENVIWSPQGDRLAFLRSSEYGKEPDIFLYDLSTKEETTLTNTTKVERSLAWSPDGSQVAFTSWNGCKQNNCLSEEIYWDIIIMDSTGSNQQVVTSMSRFESFPQDLWIASLCNLIWSPDANYIAFENECGELIGPSYWKEIFIVSVKDSEIRRLTTFTDEHASRTNKLPKTAFKYSLHWSPDSNVLFIGYTKIGIDSNGKFFGGILTLKNNDKSDTFVQGTEGILGNTVKWSLNNEHLAWHTQYVGADSYIFPGQSVVGEVENNQITIFEQSNTLLAGPCNKLGIYWSLDNKYVAYNANRSVASCNDEGIDQSIVITSLLDQTVIDIADSITGNMKVLGWVYEFKN